MKQGQLKAEIGEYLNRVDDITLLRAIRAMLSDFVEEAGAPEIGYDAHGNRKEPASMRKIYDEEVRKALEEGNYVSIDQLNQESQPWSKGTKSS